MICVILVISQYAIYTAIANAIRGIVSQSTCTISLCPPHSQFLTFYLFVTILCKLRVLFGKGVDNPQQNCSAIAVSITKLPELLRG
jgi:hypothetical protein